MRTTIVLIHSQRLLGFKGALVKVQTMFGQFYNSITITCQKLNAMQLHWKQ